MSTSSLNRSHIKVEEDLRKTLSFAGKLFFEIFSFLYKNRLGFSETNLLSWLLSPSSTTVIRIQQTSISSSGSVYSVDFHCIVVCWVSSPQLQAPSQLSAGKWPPAHVVVMSKRTSSLPPRLATFPSFTWNYHYLSPGQNDSIREPNTTS